MSASENRPTSLDLTSRVALVTGAGRGLGAAVAEQLAASGASVVVLARSRDQLDETVTRITEAGGAATALRADLADLGGLAAVAARASEAFGPIDILVNNAATVAPLGPTIGLDWERAAASLGLNVIGPAALASSVLPDMIARGWGRIVNVSSGIVARPQMMVGGNVYAVSKTALEAHTLNLAAEIDGSGVTANIYRPGTVDTAMQGYIREQDPDRIGGGLVQRFREMEASGSLITPAASAYGLVVRLARSDNGAVWDVADPTSTGASG